AGAAGPARDQRHVVARERAFAEHRACIGKSTLEPDRVAQAPGGDGFDTITMGRIEIDVGESRRAEEQFVPEPHIVDARLQAEGAVAKAHAALDVVRGLGLEIEVGGDIETRGYHTDALIDSRQPEALRRAGEYGERLVEAMLQTSMQGVLRLSFVERQTLWIRRAEQAA